MRATDLLTQHAVDLAALREGIYYLWMSCFPDREPPEPTDDKLPEQIMIDQIREYIHEIQSRRPS